MTTRFGKQVDLQDQTQMRLIKQVQGMSSRQDHVTKNISTTRVVMVGR